MPHGCSSFAGPATTKITIEGYLPRDLGVDVYLAIVGTELCDAQ